MRNAGKGALALMVAALGAGCGGMLGDESGGDPLVVLDGTIDTTGVATVQTSKLRAALEWGVVPEGEVQCLASGADVLPCLVMDGERGGSVLEDVKVENGFPLTFRMPVWGPPPEAALHRHGDAAFGFATVLAYEDRNGNGQLDRVKVEDTQSIDHVVGVPNNTFRRNAEFTYADIVFREGGLHPLWRLMPTECPPPPQGMSVVLQHYRHSDDEGVVLLGCEVVQGAAPISMALPPEGAGQFACEEPQFAASGVPWEQPVAPPAEGTTHRCVKVGLDTVLVVNNHPERFCRSSNSTVYALRDRFDGRWNLTQAPPAWWPCEVTRRY